MQDRCEIYCYDEPKVRKVQASLERQDLSGMAKMFKALSDENRMKAVFALCEEEELCVCDVANIIGSSVATASHHLRTLKDLGLAKYRKEGKLAFYALGDDRIRRLIRLTFGCGEELMKNGA